MATTLPDDRLSIFLLCEDLRTEIGNKLSFMGVFVNNDIVFPKGTIQPVSIQSLMCVLLGRGGDGPVSTKMTIFDPHGSPLLDGPLEPSVMERGKSHLMMAKLIGAPLKFGTYKVHCVFDSLTIERTFEVREL